MLLVMFDLDRNGDADDDSIAKMKAAEVALDSKNKVGLPSFLEFLGQYFVG